MEGLRAIGAEKDQRFIDLMQQAITKGQSPEYLTTHAFKIAALGPFGIARYSIQLLLNSLQVYEGMTNEIDKKRIEALEEIATIETYREKAIAAQRQVDSIQYTVYKKDTTNILETIKF
jgi:predicted NodU family carbamoyl transferase